MMFKWFAISALLMCILFSCKAKIKHNSPIIDSTLARHPIFPLMDKVYQSFSGNDSVKQSTNLELCHSFDKDARFYCADRYQCYAYFDHSETLVIQLRYPASYYSEGIKIRYSDNFYTINAFTWTHNFPDDREYPLNLYSNTLQLNRSEYKAGDSVLGYVYARAFVNIEERPTGVLLQGHFRAKIADR
jgi:hypothetical protein